MSVIATRRPLNQAIAEPITTAMMISGKLVRPG
jgi:hypothetical protein